MIIKGKENLSCVHGRTEGHERGEGLHYEQKVLTLCKHYLAVALWEDRYGQ